MNPRYDARTVARKRSLSGITLIITSPAPRMEEVHDCALEEHTARLPETRTVPLGDIWRGGGTGFISDPLIRATHENFSNGKDAFYFVNKKGYASHTVCKDCEWKGTDVPLRCPDCKGTRLARPGIGIEKIVEQAQKLFPQATVLELSSATLENPDVQNYLTQKEDKQTIIVGTALAPLEYAGIFSRFGVVAVIAGDAVPAGINFRAHEQQWRLLTALSMLAGKHTASFFVQAFSPDSAFIQSVVSGNYTQFAKDTLAERKKFGWPPYGRCIVILPKLSRGKKIHLSQIIAKIKDICAGDTVQVHILDREKPSERLLIRFPSWSPLDVPASARRIISCLPAEWLVDIDPIAL